jgi:SAM-dependent methyltransferase
MIKIKKDIDNFINIKFTYNNIRIYFVRTSIINSLKSNLKIFKGKILDIGCGKMPYKNYILNNSDASDYIGIDIEAAIIYDPNTRPNMFWDGKVLPFEKDSFDSILATEVLEHCPDPKNIFKESHRVLKDNGSMFITTPFIFPLHESPYDEYRYTPYSLERMAKEAGFKKIDIYALGDINAAVAQIISFYRNKYIRLLMVPIIYLLIKFDKRPKVFKNDVFFTGLCTIVTK